MSMLNLARKTGDLSPRQVEIIRLLAAGKSVREVGHLLGISRETVRTHTDNIRHRLHVRSMAQAVDLCWRRGVLHP